MATYIYNQKSYAYGTGPLASLYPVAPFTAPIPKKPIVPTPAPILAPKIGIIDFMKELPQSTKTVISVIGGFAKSIQIPKALEPSPQLQALIQKKVELAPETKAVISFGKEVGQSMARSFISVGAAIGPIGEKPSLANTYTPQTEIEKKIFGTDKPIGFKSIGEEMLMIGGEDFKQKWGAYSIPIGMVMAGLDIAPIGVGKKEALKVAAKAISKTDNVIKIAKSLKTIVKGTDEEINLLAKSLKLVNKESEVLKVLETTGKAKQAVPVVKEGIPKGEQIYKIIKQEGIREVKGTPVKIVNGVDTFLHEGTGGWVVSESSTGRYIADSVSKEGAIAKAKFNISNIGETKFKQIIKENQLPVTKAVKTAPVAQKGVAIAPKVGKSIIPSELQPLVQEARKYKSADEFYNAINRMSDEKLNSLGFKAGKFGITDEPQAIKDLPNGIFDFYNQAVKGVFKVEKGIIPRAKNLTPEYRAIEDKAIAKIKTSEKALLEEYKKIKGKEVNADEFKKLFKKEGYVGYNAAAVQEPSSYLVKKAFTENLKNKGKYAAFTSGGSGVGKNSALNYAPDYKKIVDKSAVILNSNLSNFDSALNKIKEAEKAGKKSVFFYVYREPLDALENGVVKRMIENIEEGGRIVPTEVVAQNHIGSWDVAKKLNEMGYDVHFWDNSLGINKAKEISFEEMKAKIKYPQNLEEIFDKKIKELLDNRTINPEQYKAYITKSIEEVKKIAEEIPTKVKKGFEWKPRQFLQSVSEARPDIELRVGGQYVPRSTDRLAMKAKTLITESIETAEKMARTGTDDNAVAVASELIKHYGDEATKATSKAVQSALYEKASDIAHITAKNLTDQGRAIQAASIMGNLTPEGILRFAAREINKYNEAVDVSKGLLGLKKKIPQLTAEQVKMITGEFKKIEAMADGTPKAMAFKKLNDAISDLIPSSLYQKIVSVWKAGLLTGLKTSGLNTFSNLFHGVSETIKDVPAAAIDSVISLFSKKRTLGLTIKETPKGTLEGFQKGWRYLATGFDERNVAVKLDWRRVSFGQSKLAKGIQKYEETIFQLMGAEDQPFYYGAKARSLMSQAIAQAKNKGLKGGKAKEFIENLIKGPTDEMLKYAINDAEMAVFQNPTTLGKIAKAIQKAPGGELVVPFGRTPSAVANQFINYSPVGIVKTIAQNIGKGKFDQRLFAQGLGRGITGTGIMWIGSELYKKGLINLSYPKGEREQKLWEVEGRTPNSIKIGDKYRNVNVLGPGGFVLVAGANFQKSLQETGSNFQALVQSAAGGVKSLSEQTFLQGINQIVSALDDPSRFFEGYFSNTISSIIPTLVGDLAKSFDEVQREAPEILDKLKAKIPGLRQTLEPQITVLGQERPKGGNWIETMIDPSRPSRVLTSDVVQELRRITEAGYNVAPTQLGDKEGYKGLTPEENTALWEKSGELINSKLNNLFNLEQYKKLPDDKKAKIIEDIVGKAKIMSRVQIVMDLTEDLSGQELKNKLSELKNGGLMIREVFEKYLELK